MRRQRGEEPGRDFQGNPAHSSRPLRVDDEMKTRDREPALFEKRPERAIAEIKFMIGMHAFLSLKAEPELGEKVLVTGNREYDPACRIRPCYEFAD